MLLSYTNLATWFIVPVNFHPLSTECIVYSDIIILNLGIRQRLDHFKYLNIDTVWISPFYKSPMRDFGYDVTNYTEIDPMFGNGTDFDNLLKEAKTKGV